MKMSEKELKAKLEALPWTCDYNKKVAQERPIYVEFYQGLEVGDGVTVHYYSDAEAYTIIKRTPCSLTLQRDKATLKKGCKPEFVPGGFGACCTNNEDLEYDYERDPNGSVLTVRWSKKEGAFMYLGKKVTAGRHEYFDYNF